MRATKPWAVRMAWAKSRRMSTASQKGSASKIWEPMWLWKPSTSRCSFPRAAATNRAAWPGFDGHTELAVDPSGVDGLEGVGVNPRGHPEEDPLPDAPGPGGLVQPVQLLGVVHDEAAHPAVQGVGDVLVGLVVAVEVEPLRGKPPGQAV